MLPDPVCGYACTYLDRTLREDEMVALRKIAAGGKVSARALRRLMESGILQGFSPAVHYSRLGLLYFVAILRNPDRQAARRILSDPRLLKWHVGVGDFTDLVEFVALKKKEARSFCESLKGIGDVLFCGEVLREEMFSHIPGAPGFSRIDVDAEPVDLDELSLRILEVLGRDATMKAIDIARTFGVDYYRVWRRVRAMREKHVLLGKYPLIAPCRPVETYFVVADKIPPSPSVSWLCEIGYTRLYIALATFSTPVERRKFAERVKRGVWMSETHELRYWDFPPGLAGYIISSR